MRARLLRVALVAVLCCRAMHAQVTLPSLFSDHAVLQRDQPIHVWGTSPAGETIEVRFHAQRVSATADMWGRWQLWLEPESAGGPYVLSAQGAREPVALERKDILVGDVWIASGQSNMEFPLAGFTKAPLLNGEDEIAHANHPKLRLLIQGRRTSAVVMSESDATWTLCTPETARGFSAVAYFFGREIAAQENVPIGLIDSTWGGTPAQSWISLESISAFNLDSVIADGARVAREQGEAEVLKARFAAEDAQARAAQREAPQHPKIPGDHSGSWAPATLFNAMIAPYTRFTIKGALWYQGEADATAERAPNYSRVFSALILDWRRQWGQGSFPFLFVQISSFGGNDNTWPTVRDQQRQTAQTVPNTGMAVTLDLGLRDNIHPPDKQTVAHRLALLALARVYGESTPSESPELLRATAEAGRIRLRLAHADGLHAAPEGLGEFEVAGDDRAFVPATVQIEGQTLLVQSSSIAQPRFVRYGWKGTVSQYLLNSTGLPLGTFSAEVH